MQDRCHRTQHLIRVSTVCLQNSLLNEMKMPPNNPKTPTYLFESLPGLYVLNFTGWITIIKCTTKTLRPRSYKTFLYSTQLSITFILLMNVKMINTTSKRLKAILLMNVKMINTTSKRLKARSFFICRYFSFYEQLS